MTTDQGIISTQAVLTTRSVSYCKLVRNSQSMKVSTIDARVCMGSKRPKYLGVTREQRTFHLALLGWMSPLHLDTLFL